MPLWSPEVIDADGSLDVEIGAVRNRPAIFAIHPREGPPYLGRTAVLRRRLLRLLGPRSASSRMLSLREVTLRVEYQITASWLEANLLFLEIARKHHPEAYRSVMRLRMPTYLKVGLSNAFPRCYLSTRLAGSRGLWCGPFRSRAAAGQFMDRFSDLFQVRRCQEDLEPAPDHPGCIYGEMNMCLRPCQQVVGSEEYASEVERVTQFLSTDGRSLMDAVTRARDGLSREMRFEEAARLHKQLESIQQVVRLRDDLARDIDGLDGVAVTASVAEGCVELWFMLAGCWLPPVRFRVEAAGDKAVSLDRRLRDLVGELRRPELTVRERQDHLAVLARWYYSSYRDGEWLAFDGPANVPYRKLVRAISRVAGKSAEPQP